jgi:hypothetical protein
VKKVHRHVSDVPQGIGDRGTEIIERHFQAYGVKRAADLPEEGKVHLYREMQHFLQAEIPQGSLETGPRGAWSRWVERLKALFTSG